MLVNTKRKFDPVKVRFKSIANGNKSIYLDYQLSDGTRKTEYLKMYIVAGGSSDARKLNTHTLRAVANIKAERLRNLAWNREANAGVELSRRLLVDVIDEYASLRLKRGARTALGVYGSVRRHVACVNPSVRLWEVNLSFVTDLANSMMGRLTPSGRPYARSTIVGVISSLSSVMNYAVRRGMVGSNPVERFDMRKVKGTVHRRCYLIGDELRRLAVAPCGNEDYKRLFLFACFVGLRFSDLISLRWRDVVEVGGEWRIEKMMSKTRHMVFVPVNQLARRYMPPRGGADELVFGHIPRNVGGINLVLKEWAAEAGVDKDVTFYTSRHTFATLSLTHGADIYSVSRLLGHKDVKTTEGYAQIIDRKRVEAVYRLDMLFEDYLSQRRRHG